MKKLFILSLLVSVFLNSYTQERYYTKTAFVSFLSETLLEDIYAESKEATTFIDLKTGEVVFSIPMRSFHFKRKLMEEHFNENFVESDKFPKATFSGMVDGIEKFDWSSSEKQSFKVSGEINIHGVEKELSTTVTFIPIDGQNFTGESTFKLKPADFDIKIPTVVFQKIAEELVIDVKADYQVFKKQQ